MLDGGLPAADGGFAAAPALGEADRATGNGRASAVITPVPGELLAEHEQSSGLALRAAGNRRAIWERRYQWCLVGIDLLAVAAALLLGYVARFGLPLAHAGTPANLAFSVLLPAVWVTVIALNRGYEPRFVGVGSIEYARVFRSFLHVTVLTAFAAFAAHMDVARGLVIAVLPIAVLLDLLLRYGARKRLHRLRSVGSALVSVLAVGGPDSLGRFAEMVRRDQYAGMRVVGACLPNATVADSEEVARLADLGVPVLGDVDTIRESARACGADTVAVLSGEISAEKLRWISWQLEETEIDLVVSPGLVEVGGRRLHIQPVAGLPLLYVDEPEFTGLSRLVKSAFDRLVAGFALLVLSPLLAVIAVAVRLDSQGRSLFRQQRVGLRGEAFTMVKFRSMCADAEQRLVELSQDNESDGTLFKIRRDPRVTRVGRVLRKYSLDELPQLLNVVRGDMSLVGPRPPLPSEVASYGDDVRRRLLVKPGITGLWQVSGRSDLSWEESVRLDLRYVENWTLATDLLILWKTIFAVAASRGAY